MAQTEKQRSENEQSIWTTIQSVQEKIKEFDFDNSNLKKQMT